MAARYSRRRYPTRTTAEADVPQVKAMRMRRIRSQRNDPSMSVPERETGTVLR